MLHHASASNLRIGFDVNLRRVSTAANLPLPNLERDSRSPRGRAGLARRRGGLYSSVALPDCRRFFAPARP